MADGIYLAMSGAAAQEKALDVVANNLANASTVGFRAERTSFAETLARNATGSGEMAFVGLAGSAIDTTPGKQVETGNPLDLALSGNGYFVVETPAGLRYTRAGDFRLDASGTLVTVEGLVVRGIDNKGISVPPWVGEVQVDTDGTVRTENQEFGTIAIAELDPASLVREGNRLFSGVAIGTNRNQDTEIIAGSLEEANFPALRGMVDLVRISRVHEAQHRMIEAYRQIDNRAARDLGRGK